MAVGCKTGQIYKNPIVLVILIKVTTNCYNELPESFPPQALHSLGSQALIWVELLNII